jgi:hypothetical protein
LGQSLWRCCSLLALPVVAACGATLQDIRAATRDLAVQMSRLEESVARENEKARLDAQKELQLQRRSFDDLSALVTKARGALEAELGVVKAKIAELNAALAVLRKAAQAGGTPIALTEIEVRAIGENHYRVSRKQFAEHAYELTRMAAQVPVVAHFEGDKRVGLRLTEGNPFLGRFGVLDGDVLLRINKLELRRPDQTRDVFRAVQSAGEVTLELKRGPERLTIRVTVAE